MDTVWLEPMADGTWIVYDTTGPGMRLIGVLTAEQYDLVITARRSAKDG